MTYTFIIQDFGSMTMGIPVAKRTRSAQQAQKTTTTTGVAARGSLKGPKDTNGKQRSTSTQNRTNTEHTEVSSQPGHSKTQGDLRSHGRASTVVNCADSNGAEGTQQHARAVAVTDISVGDRMDLQEDMDQVDRVDKTVDLTGTSDCGEVTDQMDIDQMAQGTDNEHEQLTERVHHPSLSPDATEDEYQPSSIQYEPSEGYNQIHEEEEVPYHGSSRRESQDPHTPGRQESYPENEEETLHDWTPDSRYETQVPRGPDYEEYRWKKEENRRRKEAGEEVELLENWTPHSQYESQVPQESDYPDYLGQDEAPFDERYDGGRASEWRDDDVGCSQHPDFTLDQRVNEAVRTFFVHHPRKNLLIFAQRMTEFFPPGSQRVEAQGVGLIWMEPMLTVNLRCVLTVF